MTRVEILCGDPTRTFSTGKKNQFANRNISEDEERYRYNADDD